MCDSLDKTNEFIRTFDKILELCEDSTKLDCASESTIKEVFSLAVSVENFYRKALSTGSIDAMQKHILQQWKQRGRNIPAEIAVFEESCDLILTACFRSHLLPGRSLCTAVQEYEHHCGNDRLQELIVHLLREGLSCQLMHTVSSAPPSVLSTVFVGWRNMIECGQSAKVKALVKVNLQRNFALLRHILQFILRTDHEDENISLKSLLLTCVITEMKGENCKTFCDYLVNSIDASILVSVAENYPHFLTTLLDSLQILAVNAELQCQRVGVCVEYSWKNLDFPLVLVQLLCEQKGPVGSRTLSWLSVLQARPGGTFWEDMAAYCGL